MTVGTRGEICRQHESTEGINVVEICGHKGTGTLFFLGGDVGLHHESTWSVLNMHDAGLCKHVLHLLPILLCEEIQGHAVGSTAK